jgi:hypothetical protein
MEIDMDQLFLKRHNLDAWFWGLVWIYAVVIIGFGFAPPVRERFFDEIQEPASMALVIHVWSFFAWMCLLAFQAFVAATKRLKWHRQLGIAMLPLAAVMIWSGLASELQFQQRSLENGRDNSDFFAVTATYLLTFSVLVSLAWLNRRNPPAHKRLILLATAAILGGAHMRIWGDAWPESWIEESFFSRLLFYFAGTLIIVAMGMMHDFMTRQRLHRVYILGAPCLLATYISAIALHDSAAWSNWVRPFLAG